MVWFIVHGMISCYVGGPGMNALPAGFIDVVMFRPLNRRRIPVLINSISLGGE